jgi:hypothetical protein
METQDERYWYCPQGRLVQNTVETEMTPLFAHKKVFLKVYPFIQRPFILQFSCNEESSYFNGRFYYNKKWEDIVPQSASDYAVLRECQHHTNEIGSYPKFWHCSFTYIYIMYALIGFYRHCCWFHNSLWTSKKMLASLLVEYLTTTLEIWLLITRHIDNKAII